MLDPEFDSLCPDFKTFERMIYIGMSRNKHVVSHMRKIDSTGQVY